MAEKKKHLDPDDFSEETVKKKRKFPKSNLALLIVFAVLQVLLILFAIVYQPKPQDVISDYVITVTPEEDGGLIMEYSFVWTALDTDEPLTWINVGVANSHVNYYPSTVSSNIKNITLVDEEDGYTALRLDLDRAYRGGEVLRFSFTVKQYDVLCKDEHGYFYEIVPGWFNSTPVNHYTFRWATDKAISSTNAPAKMGSYYVWEGEMPCGSYVKMNVRYGSTTFADAYAVEHEPFDDSGVYSALWEEKLAIIVLIALFIILLGLAQMYLVDSFVSYRRGRGFLRGYGHHVHVYGYSNPHYVSARNLHNASSGGRGGFSGGGCACACACACAGGGRAGCSQKDGVRYKKD
jgi:multisubunit Na+/H+ antiporter MnhB subunit